MHCNLWKGHKLCHLVWNELHQSYRICKFNISSRSSTALENHLRNRVYLRKPLREEPLYLKKQYRAKKSCQRIFFPLVKVARSAIILSLILMKNKSAKIKKHPVQSMISFFFLASSQHWQVSYTNPHDIVICTNCPSLLCLPAWLFSINKWEKTSFGYKISFDTWHKKDEKPYLRKTFSSL